MSDRASLTAEYMALFRALESALPANARLFCDPFAPLFLSGRRKWAGTLARSQAGRRLMGRLLDRESPGARAAGIARTQWIDEQVTAAMETCPQLVLLGAGFDTRAYRLPAAARASTFEFDHPETLAAKQAILRKLTGSLPKRVRCTGIDFNSEPLTEALRRAGFAEDQRACFVWEGVTNYLSPDAVDKTLRQVAQASSGSILLFTYVDRKVIEEPRRFFGAEKLMSRLRSYGEPWTFGFDPGEVEAYLAARTIRLVKDLGVAEIWQTAGRPAADIQGYEFYRVASATVQG